MKNGIDVSHWQGSINWEQVKKAGIHFAIIKAGGSDAGFYTDSKFVTNYASAKAVGIKVGAYYFVGKGCKSYADGAADAQRFLNIIKGKQFEYPVYIDFEAPDASNKSGNTQACIGFCKHMEQHGYYCGIYSSDISGFVDRLNMNELTPYTWWVARYGSEPKRARQNLHIWQKSSTGRVAGISGNVDLNESYVDFEDIIVPKGLNGFPKKDVVNIRDTTSTFTPQPPKTIEQRLKELEQRVGVLEAKSVGLL